MRQQFHCVKCGLRLAGKIGRDGIVHPYDKAPTSNAPSLPAMCVSCGQKR